MMLSSKRFMLFIAVCLQCRGGHLWSYEDPNWTAEAPICGSKTQSPIDFMPASVLWNASIPPLKFNNYDSSYVNFTEFDLVNNGHSVQMNINNTGNGTTPFSITGGVLPAEFILAQFHFHWGDKDHRGSEHTIEDAHYAMEAHLVHWDATKYPDFSTASNATDGLAVLGIFVQVSGNQNNSMFDSIIKYFGDIKFKGSEADKVTFVPLSMLLPNNTNDFYTYRGSLTTPPCYNSVIWTVFRQPITISELQMQEFRTRLYEEEQSNATPRTPIVNNYRETQPEYDRNVYKTFEKVEWSYEGSNGVDSWKFLYPRCNGISQSPINIQTANVVDKNIPAITFTNYLTIPSDTKISLFNSGKGISLVISNTNSIRISGGNLTGQYILSNVTLHWGKSNGEGSDHRVNSLAYPLEMQFIHYSSSYSDVKTASAHPGGLAILSVFFQASPEDNDHLHSVWNQLKDVAYPSNMTVVSLGSLSNWIPPNSASFYQYSGSLTVPNCAETVNWIVFTDPLKVSANQMTLLRDTINGDSSGTIHPQMTVFRPTQALNSRPVIRSLVPEPTVSVAATNLSLLSQAAVLLVLLAASTSLLTIHQ